MGVVVRPPLVRNLLLFLARVGAGHAFATRQYVPNGVLCAAGVWINKCVRGRAGLGTELNKCVHVCMCVYIVFSLAQTCIALARCSGESWLGLVVSGRWFHACVAASLGLAFTFGALVSFCL